MAATRVIAVAVALVVKNEATQQQLNDRSSHNQHHDVLTPYFGAMKIFTIPTYNLYDELAGKDTRRRLFFSLHFSLVFGTLVPHYISIYSQRSPPIYLPTSYQSFMTEFLFGVAFRLIYVVVLVTVPRREEIFIQ